MNYNYLPANTHKLSIPGLDVVTFFVQEINLPQVSVESTESPIPGINLKTPGNQVRFSDLEVTFIIDEDMKSYEEIFKWIVGQQYSTDESYDKFVNLVTDASLSVMTANSTHNRVISFSGLFPVSLSGPIFRTTDSDVTYMTATATFSFNYFKFTV